VEGRPDAGAERANASTNDDVKALWIAGLLCVDAERAVAILEKWIAGGADGAVQQHGVPVDLVVSRAADEDAVVDESPVGIVVAEATQ
jgi:hypothetical protein